MKLSVHLTLSRTRDTIGAVRYTSPPLSIKNQTSIARALQTLPFLPALVWWKLCPELLQPNHSTQNWHTGQYCKPFWSVHKFQSTRPRKTECKHSPKERIIAGIQEQRWRADVGDVLQAGALLIVLLSVAIAQRMGHARIFNVTHSPASHGSAVCMCVYTTVGCPFDQT